MSIRSLTCIGVLLGALLLGMPCQAAWWDVYRATAEFDMPRARKIALESLTTETESADAVAVAAWWLEHLDSITDPEALVEVLDASPGQLNPELILIRDLIESELANRAPASALLNAELSGPFGVHELLDLERNVVPRDHDLPSMGTRWTSFSEPIRLQLRTAEGRISPPEPLYQGGVYLAAWNFVTEADFNGYLVIYSEHHFNLEFDGVPVDQLRFCGEDDPAESWFTLTARAGAHRIRISMADFDRPFVQVFLIDPLGSRPPESVGDLGDRALASSQVRRLLPPASESLRLHLDDTAKKEDLLLAAYLARRRTDPRRQYEWLRRAREAYPDSPWPAFMMADYLLQQATGSAAESDARKARELLQECSSIPLSRLFEYQLSIYERRPEDTDRILDDLMETASNDPRILYLWVRHATQRDWVGEAEEAITTLQRMLPDSRLVTEMRLGVLEALERWDERNALLLELTEENNISPRRIEQLAGNCFLDAALTALQRIQENVDDPIVDLAIVRLAAESGQIELARAEIERLERTWGSLLGLKKLQLLVSSSAGDDLLPDIEGILRIDPSDLQLRSLAWKLGMPPFFAPYRLEDFTADIEVGETTADSIVVLDQAVERVFESGSSLYYYHGITKAMTAEGARQAATLQQLPDSKLLQVRIIKPDGRIVIPPSLDAHNGGGVLSDVMEGDIVEEEYVSSIGSANPLFKGHMSPYVYRFADPERAFGRSEYIVLRDPTIELDIDGNFDSLIRQDEMVGELASTRWLAEAMDPVPREPLAPPVQEILPWVAHGFGVEWTMIGDNTRNRMISVLRTSAELREWSATVMRGKTAADAVHALVESLCDEVAAENAVLDVSQSAGGSFSLRRGNRLGILAAVLANAGWTVDLVLARPRHFAGTHLKAPTMDAFSMPVLRVENAGQVIWVDIREERAGVNHINPVLQGSDGLVLPLTRPNEDCSILAELPHFENPEIEDRMLVRADIGSDGGARITVKIPMFGPRGESMFERFSSLPRSEEEQEFARLAATLFPASSQVSGTAHRNDTGVVIELQMTVRNLCTVTGNEMECRDVIPVRALAPTLASLPDRRYPLILQIPIVQHLTLDVDMPDGWTFTKRPRRIETSWGHVEETIQVKESHLSSQLVLRVDAQTVSPETYPAFARFCHAVDELLLRPLTLVRVNS